MWYVSMILFIVAMKSRNNNYLTYFSLILCCNIIFCRFSHWYSECHTNYFIVLSNVHYCKLLRKNCRFFSLKTRFNCSIIYLRLKNWLLRHFSFTNIAFNIRSINKSYALFSRLFMINICFSMYLFRKNWFALWWRIKQ